MSRVLMISPTPTHPATAGNRVRIAGLLDAMTSLGLEVHFMHVEREPGDREAMRRAWGERYIPVPYTAPRTGSWRRRLRRVGRRFGVDAAYRYSIDAWYDPGTDAAARSVLSKLRFSAVVVEYVFLSRVFGVVPAGVLKVLDTHDVFSDRHRMYLGQGREPVWFSCSPREEARALARADVTMAIKDVEAAYLRGLARTRVVTVGHLATRHNGAGAVDATPTIALLGSANAINVESTRWFIEAVLPEIRRQVSNVRTLVAGSVCSGLPETPDVELLGVVDDVADVYRSAALVVNPMRYGTGLKIKTVEALGYGKAVITTPVGAEGLEPGAGRAFRVADEPGAFAAEAVGLLRDAGQRHDLELAAHAYIDEYNAGTLAQFTRILEPILPRCRQ